MENQNIKMIELIFNVREEDLAIITEQDKKFMSQDKANRSKKNFYLMEEIEKIPDNLEWLKENIIKLLNNYVDAIDFEGAYFYKKYYLEGLKDGIKLKEELK